MNKVEFLYTCELMTNTKNLVIGDDEYKTIELVYAFHPSISETCGKEQIAWLYTRYGMCVINDMKPRAIRARELETKISQAKAAYDNAMREYNRLKSE